MPTDKNESAESQVGSKSGSPIERPQDGVKRSGDAWHRFSDTAEHIYEPEAHHKWFPSERFFLSWLTVGTIGFICLCFALTAHHIFNPGFHVGDIAEREIRATHAIAVVDEQATREAQERARAEAVPIFKPIEGRVAPWTRVKERIDFVALLQKSGLAAIPDLPPDQQLAALNVNSDDWKQLMLPNANPVSGDLHNLLVHLQALSHGKPLRDSKAIIILERQRAALAAVKSEHPELGEPEQLLALALPASSFQSYRDAIQSSMKRLQRVLSKLPIEDESVLQETAFEFLPDQLPVPLRKTSAAMVASAMSGTTSIDKAATHVKAEKAAQQVKPVMKQISSGEVIVHKMGVLTPEIISTLQAMGVTDANRWPIVGGLLVSLTAAVALVALFLYTFEAKMLFSTRSIALMYTIAVIAVVLSVVLGKTYPQAVPVPAAALLLSIFFDRRAAVAIVLPVAIFIAVDKLCDFNNIIALSTAAGVAIATYSKRRHALMSTGLLIGVFQAFGFLAALAVSQTPLTATELGSKVGLEFLGGLASSIIAIGMLPFLENIFGLVTPFRLAELTDADQPLLRRLEENAPGTYQHSLAVANLAEAGARAIGADVNLVRAGAFYHDVGKMVRPKYFIENQLGATNPHDSMTPEQSRERVLAHVTDGLELAKQYALPKSVQDFIPMHQGTSLMAYFYHKACMRDGVDNVDAMFYRYPGPKPQSKETSIVMLADVSEAVTHSMKDPTEEEVEAAMVKVFQNRWDDGQFSESGLAYSELLRIRKAFVRVWRTLHHDRLKYPATTTGRMPMPPSNLPTAASLSNVVTANEFAAELPVSDESGTHTTVEPNNLSAGDESANGKKLNNLIPGNFAAKQPSPETHDDAGHKDDEGSGHEGADHALRDEGCS